MKVILPHATLELVKGDITHQEVDAIVNAANQHLAGGGGVDGAIHLAGGPSILEELTRKFPQGCSTGDAVATGAGRLRAKFVFHAVGPRYVPGKQDWCEERLREAYRNSFQLAAERRCRSIAFPSISTGIYRFPVADASRIALRTARDFMVSAGSVELVRWVLFDDATYQAFVGAAEDIFPDFRREQ